MILMTPHRRGLLDRLSAVTTIPTVLPALATLEILPPLTVLPVLTALTALATLKILAALTVLPVLTTLTALASLKVLTASTALTLLTRGDRERDSRAKNNDRRRRRPSHSINS